MHRHRLRRIKSKWGQSSCAGDHLIRTFVQSPRRLLWLATIIVLVVQTVLFARSAAIHGFATGDGSVKLWQVQGILRTGDLNAPLDYPGAIYDPDHQYAPFVEPWAFWKDGKFYSEYTSPFIWASVPLYAVFGHAGLMILPWLSGMLLVVMAAWLAWRVRPDRSAALVPLIVGLASPLTVYSLEFWEHTPGTALAVVALVAIVKALDESPSFMVVDGIRRGDWPGPDDARRIIRVSNRHRHRPAVHPIGSTADPIDPLAGDRRPDHGWTVVAVSIHYVGQPVRAALAAERGSPGRHRNVHPFGRYDGAELGDAVARRWQPDPGHVNVSPAGRCTG